jgi:hypothetical protein
MQRKGKLAKKEAQENKLSSEPHKLNENVFKSIGWR